jgi:TIR domain
MTEHAERDDADPRQPLFFLSYAHSGTGRRSQGPRHEANRYFIKFFDDLSENVAELVARQTGSDPGFMDRAIPDGGRWNRELLNALGRCQVFVALLSVRYVTSSWCGREWHGFSQRRVIPLAGPASGEPTGIIPVSWAPVPVGRLPKVIRDVQHFSPTGLPDPDITAQYEAEGVYGLLQLRLEDAYQAVVWRLAQRIADFHHNHRVESATFDGTELRDIFREQ